MALNFILRTEGYNAIYKCSYCGKTKILNISNAKKTESCGCSSVKLRIKTKKEKSEKDKEYNYNNKLDYTSFKLKNGKEVMVDKEDFCKIKGNTWYETKRGSVESRINGKLTKLHKVIIDCPIGMVIDHINRNHLDNRKSNLRICTQRENIMNTGPKKGKYKGVYKLKNNKYHARIKGINIGYFNTEIEGAKAYDEYAKKIYGEYAFLNFE